MNKEELIGLKVSLMDDEIIEDFTFGPDSASATMGSRSGPVCAPILECEYIQSNEVILKGSGFTISWKNISLENGIISVLRNGIDARYKIVGKAKYRKQERRLP